MKTLSLMVLAFLCCSLAYGQQNTPKKAKPTKLQPLPPPPVKYPSDTDSDNKKCFIYKAEEQKDSLTFVEETLLEYTGTSGNAREIITRYSYDPIEKKQAEKNGDIVSPRETLQFINGKFKIEKNILTFTPDKLDKFKVHTFKIVHKSKTLEINYLLDENSNKFTKGECMEPMISL